MSVNFKSATGWGERVQAPTEPALATMLLRAVDACLFGIICVAPFVFGGRHDLGRLVFVSLVAVAAAAWCLYQTTQHAGGWPRTWAYAVLLMTASLIILQMVPLPEKWIATLSPSTVELLPLWRSSGDPVRLGTWRTLSLNPHETAKSLAMLLSYSLLFVVVAGRIRTVAEIAHIHKWIAAAAVLMAAFGLLQYFTAGGRYFWFFDHPFRPSSRNINGAFINRNHFAHFLILGLGPLVAWLLQILAKPAHTTGKQETKFSNGQRLGAWLGAAAVLLVTLAVVGSRSRGAALVFVVAGAVLTAIYFHRRLVDRRFVLGLIGLAIAVGGLLSLYGYERVVNRLDDFAEFSVEEMDQAGARRKIWAANVEAVKSFPVIGTGAGSHLEAAAIYLKDPSTKKYSHAESGYLQVASENGLVGVALLLIGVAIVGSWCTRCFFASQSAAESRLFGAAAAGLVASVVHSVFDFVWYIPACMSITIVLTASVLRLSQLSNSAPNESAGMRVLRRGRWFELAAATVLIGAWSVHTYVGPAVAAVHWNRYLRASVADAELAAQSVEQFVAGEKIASQEPRRALSQSMLRHLQAAAEWDPNSARVQARLAERYVTDFELHSIDSVNRMEVGQIRATAIESGFTSPDQLDDWLGRAFGPQSQQLRLALDHARRAVQLCPLQAEAYLQLADLSFLELQPAAQKAYVSQSLRIRPNNRNVLVYAGRQAILNNDCETAVEHWSKCFSTPGRHQQEITYLLVASGMQASEFVTRLRPTWQTLPLVWAQYRMTHDPQQLASILFYATNEAEKHTKKGDGISPAYVWYRLANFHDDLKQTDESLACMQRAYQFDPRQYATRRALAKKLQDAGRLAEAEPHIRWCLARRPADKSLSEALEAIAKARFAQRDIKATP
jgi:O-antigen ligase/tetratricopeptide (TPR) repeat protein